MPAKIETAVLRERVAHLEDMLRREREHIARLESRAEHAEPLVTEAIKTIGTWTKWYEEHRAVCPMHLRALYE